MTRRILSSFVVAALAALLPGVASAADFHATPSTLASMFSQAQGGDTVYLASGSYGAFNGGQKASTVLVAAAPGAAVTMAGGTFNAASNITVQGVRYTAAVGVLGGSTKINFDRDIFDNLGTGANEGRLGYLNGSSGTVSNSHFGAGGCSDGIQITGGGGAAPSVNILGNEFDGLRQNSCGPHVDAVQYYGGQSPRVEDNYFHNVSTGIEGYDSNGQIDVFKNNVLIGDESQSVLLATSNKNGVFTHNVVLGRDLHLDPGHANNAPTGNVIKDNVADSIVIIGGSNNTVTNNLTASQVTFAGGTGRCAYAMKTPKATASDGTDIGLNDCGATQPPPPPSDTTAPDTTITSAPANPTTSTSASFAFTATESGSAFTCKLDAGAYAACTSPKAYTGLTAASHTFSVRATDAAGNTDASSATKTWTVQSASTPPPTDHQPVAAYTDTPTAPSTGQAVTFDASSATCVDAPCSYTWQDDGTDGPGGRQWPLGSGRTMAFTFQGAGVKNVRVNVTDVDGDMATTMKAINVAAAGSTPPPADTTAPNTTITSGPTGTTTDNTPTFAFTASESASTFQCQLDSGAWAACTSPWTTKALTDGMHGIAVRATDAAGNTDATAATQSFSVAAAAAPQTLIGDSTVQTTPDSNGAGTAESFKATARASGTTTKMSVYVATGNTAGTMVVGIYSDANGHPGTLLTKGTRSGLTAGTWNTVTVPAASVTAGRTYWVGLLGTGGTLQFRGGAAAGCRSEGSQSSTLSTLPSTWATGARWGTCPPSAYATS